MLWGIFLVFCILGTVQHFLFQPLGRPRALLWLLPVSESPWEHYKLSFWPLGGALGTVALLTGLPFSAFVCAWFAGAGHAFCTMLGIYCFYRWGLGVKRPVLCSEFHPPGKINAIPERNSKWTLIKYIKMVMKLPWWLRH